MAAIPLPREIEERIELAERMVDSDLARITGTLNDLDAIPEESFDDPSIVRHIEELRNTVTATERAARRSSPPPMAAEASGTIVVVDRKR